jgi:hypothetical protein
MSEYPRIPHASTGKATRHPASRCTIIRIDPGGTYYTYRQELSEMVLSSTQLSSVAMRVRLLAITGILLGGALTISVYADSPGTGYNYASASDFFSSMGKSSGQYESPLIGSADAVAQAHSIASPVTTGRQNSLLKTGYSAERWQDSTRIIPQNNSHSSYSGIFGSYLSSGGIFSYPMTGAAGGAMGGGGCGGF